MKFGLSEDVYGKVNEVIKKFPKYKIKLFGSRARGDYKKTSDIDLAVYGDVTEQDEYKIRNEFDLLCIPYTIDIVFVSKITKEGFINSIKEEGVDFN